MSSSQVFGVNNKKNLPAGRQGFTLIELMIVVSIIAVLSVVGILAYTSALKNSRDAKRQADLKFIQSALEAYNADQLAYPADLNSLVTNSYGKVYMNQLPLDPINSGIYVYGYSLGGCSGYCLGANLEGSNGPASDYNCVFTGHTYCVTRP